MRATPRRSSLRPLAGRLAALLLTAAAFAFTAPTPATADEGSVLAADYTGPAGTRHYFVYAPPGDSSGRPLLVFLHGCGDMLSTDADPDPAVVRDDVLARLAREHGFVVAYPIQSPDANLLGCWNFTDPHDQHRGSGEPALLAGITEAVRDRYALDPHRVYLAGHSGGALMATIMGAAYPDLYTAISTWCSGAYATGTDITGTAAYTEMGPRARPIPALLVEATNDPLSSPPVGRIALDQWLATNLLAAGHPPAPLPTPDTVTHHDPDPANGFRHSSTREDYHTGSTPVSFLTLDGATHTLAGDLTGVTRTAIEFLLTQHR
ncbi:alpha/beta hydrolase family esterase [Nocardia sp. NPDC004068]|uniref:extracellular catalytic domain type 1 short-chain-length polyhydroxyalkanoate depolymerase n=1 Tax=Nocardia sp. NPDC004068 TaxID=3364303 RepID=UPI0036892A5C